MDKIKEHSGLWQPSEVAAGAELGLWQYTDPSVGCRWRVDGKYFAAGDQRLRIHGVTYGPFAPNSAGEQFPTRKRVADDFRQMGAIGINALRTYHLPPEWFLELADECGMNVFVDVPWPRHLCFLEDRHNRNEARRQVRRAAEQGRRHRCLFAYS